MFLLKADEAAREMAARGLNQRELARLAGVDPSTISKAMAGRQLQLESVIKIRQALDRLPPLPLPDIESIADPVRRGPKEAA